MDKISPKITETAKLLWMLYVGFTIAETLLLMLGGMSLFDALTHTFGTLATGGFSPKNASVGHYNSAYIDAVITLFMILAGLNFGIYYRVFKGRFKDVLKNTEMWVYLFIFGAATLFITIVLWTNGGMSVAQGLRFASFQSASILTTTGYATADFDMWPHAAKIVLFTLMFIGGCSGSTGGGMKVIRIATLFKQSINEMKYLVHPRGVYRIRLNKEIVRKDFIYTVAGFVFLYLTCLLVTTIIVATGGYNIVTSFSSALVTVGNIGPGFDLIGPIRNYAFYPVYIKWILSFAMMVGRLEVYTVLVILTPGFWRR